MDTSLFTEEGKYLMLAFDHRDSFKKLINPDNPQEVSIQEVEKYKRDIINALKNSFSGALIDPDQGLEAYKSLGIEKPYLLPIEESGYQSMGEERITVVNKTAGELKGLGASGVKLLVYFNPDGESANQQIQTAKKVLEDSHNNGLPLFLEIVTYGAEDKDRVLRSVEMFTNNDVIPDVFKLEFPGDGYLCKKVTEFLGLTPWIILTRGADYVLFSEQLRISAQNGCRGFLAGRSVWQDYLTAKDSEKKEELLDKTIPERFEEIKEIVLSS